MHATCGYPVKSTWLKAIKAGNFLGWPVINERTVSKYYPETTETPKGHMNQTRKNVRSTKKHENFELTQASRAPKLGSADAVLSRGEYDRKSETIVPQAFEEPNTRKLAGRKARDVYTKVYDVRNTVFFGPNWTVSNPVPKRQQVPNGHGRN